MKMMRKNAIKIYGEIKGIKYKLFLASPLTRFGIEQLDKALSEKGNFILKVNSENEIAVSWWVSPKRTRSYPYARVYDTLACTCKRVTIIPIMKDEGKDGERDFLQWDTISLMSLLGVHVIVAYYVKADRACRHKDKVKITNQRFDTEYLKKEIQRLVSYQSDALHWNLEQIDKISDIADRAFNSYKKISEDLGVEMHSMESARERIQILQEGKKQFMELSRELAHKAQERESRTVQPKERLNGTKGEITIKNDLGGYYYFTCDEVEICGTNIYLIEGKHTSKRNLPSKENIKDGLIKMMLYTNLENVKVDDKEYDPIPVLKLTTKGRFDEKLLSEFEHELFNLLKEEAKCNGFRIRINETVII
ncbi:MAG: hypothetical protein ACPLVG_01190 [Pseudothermotoga sp.]|jgi:hypothetical protein